MVFTYIIVIFLAAYTFYAIQQFYKALKSEGFFEKAKHVLHKFTSSNEGEIQLPEQEKRSFGKRLSDTVRKIVKKSSVSESPQINVTDVGHVSPFASPKSKVKDLSVKREGFLKKQLSFTKKTLRQFTSSDEGEVPQLSGQPKPQINVTDVGLVTLEHALPKPRIQKRPSVS